MGNFTEKLEPAIMIKERENSIACLKNNKKHGSDAATAKFLKNLHYVCEICSDMWPIGISAENTVVNLFLYQFKKKRGSVTDFILYKWVL